MKIRSNNNVARSSYGYEPASLNTAPLFLFAGVTHLPEVQCIDLLSVLSAVGGKDMPDGEHKATPMSSSGSSSDDSGGSSFNDGAGSAAAPPAGDSPFPVLCLVLATDGVWYVTEAFEVISLISIIAFTLATSSLIDASIPCNPLSTLKGQLDLRGRHEIRP